MKNISIFLILIFFCSCQSPEQSLFEFDPQSIDGKAFALSQIADDIKYIPLDNQYPLIDTHFPKLTRNSIYLFSPNGIIAFNRNGKNARVIGKRGRGPEEYTYGYEFTVDDNFGTVYIKAGTSSIMVFSEYGNYIRTISLEKYKGALAAIDFFDSKIFLSYYLQFGEAKYDWIILDTLGNVLQKKDRSFPMFFSNWSGNYNTYKLDNRLYYWNSYSDTVFSIFPDLTIKPSLTIRPGEHRLPRASFNVDDKLVQFLRISTLFETEKFFILKYAFKKKGEIKLIDKKNRNTLSALWENQNTGGILNDIDCGIDFQPKGLFEENKIEYLLELVDPYKIKSIVKSSEFKNSTPKYPKKKVELEKLANSLKETDNPVLVMVRLKK